MCNIKMLQLDNVYSGGHKRLQTLQYYNADMFLVKVQSFYSTLSHM